MLPLRTVFHTLFSDKYTSPQKYHAYVAHNGRYLLAQKLTQIFLKHCKPDTYVLDLAAGTGIVSESLVTAGYQVTAADLNQHMLKYLHARLPQVSTQAFNYNQPFPISDNHFQLVTNVWGNRYITELDNYLSEIYRVLIPSGYFIWPIFKTESLFWKLRSGITQPTGPQSLSHCLKQHRFKKITIDTQLLHDSQLRLIQRPVLLIAQK